MAGFRKFAPITEADAIIEGTISSITVTKGDLLESLTGATTWTACTSSSLVQTPKAIALESRTTSHTTIRLLLVDTVNLYVAETGSETSTDHNGDNMVLTDTNTVNNSGTNSTNKEAVVKQFQPIGAAANKEILIRFNGLFGNVVTFA